MRLLLALCLLVSALPGRCENSLEPRLGGVFDGSMKRPAAEVNAGKAKELGLADLRPRFDRGERVTIQPAPARPEQPEQLRYLSIPMGLTAAGLATGLDWNDRNTMLHVGLSAAGTYIGSDILQKAFGLKQWQATLISGSLMMGAGLYKEYAMDRRPDGKDIAADAAGVLTGAGLKFLLTF